MFVYVLFVKLASLKQVCYLFSKSIQKADSIFSGVQVQLMPEHKDC